MIEAKEIFYIDADNMELVVLCSDEKYYIFKLSRMLEAAIPIEIKDTWSLLADDNNFSNVRLISGNIVWNGICEILNSEITTYMEEFAIDSVIYKDDIYTIAVNFYKIPAIVSLLANDEILLKIDINGTYIAGENKYLAALTKWLNDVDEKLDDIIWEWNNGNDDFKLIEDKFTCD